jgi:hypothetical protein
MPGRIAAPAIAAAVFLAALPLQVRGAASVQGLSAFAAAGLPQPPPTAGAPVPPPPGSAPSPILTWPGPIGTAPLGPRPTYPAPTYPGPLSQQEMQSYRTDLLDRQLRLERAGVSPASPSYRDIQQQLNRLGP